MTTNGEPTSESGDMGERGVFLREELDAQRQDSLAQHESVDIRAHDNDSREALNEKLSALHELEEKVRAAIDAFGNPVTTRESLLKDVKDYAEQLHMDFDDTTSLGILADMPEVIADYRNDIAELLAKKQ